MEMIYHIDDNVPYNYMVEQRLQWLYIINITWGFLIS